MKAKRDMEKKRPVYSDLRKTNEGELPYGGRSRAEMQRLANEDSTVAEELAASLSHLAVDEKIAGRPQSALLAEGQAIQVRRKWAATHPTIANHLSESLMNYAFDLSEQERQADAAEATEESIALQRQLLETSTNSDSNPSATKILADSLENLSVHLSLQGRAEDALRAQAEE
ncbi:hypothetical protein FB45DRAFT_83082 [Roridomyces roridus]|uniref:Uncharacterized protein n=1 Tax=Roridomyces roridus TaxID=1738132 RepID=A0AAD7BLF6_9AGAR|nr:hypothetical protein FB45DRAFT_83082 [Roridomyces roridus]